MVKNVSIFLQMAKTSPAFLFRSFSHDPSMISISFHGSASSKVERERGNASTIPLSPVTETEMTTRRRRSSSFGHSCKVFGQRAKLRSYSEMKTFHSSTSRCDQANPRSEHATREKLERETTPENGEPVNAAGSVIARPKKLKGKRAVVRWLKSFRWKKKKEYERMTAEEKILYKLKKARNKEARFAEALEKIDPADTSETTHDPEILTPEEHFYFLKMGRKSRNYVPIGRRGIYQGVILNMHLHWKKHQTLKVIVKTFSPEEVREIAAELARLSGGIVLDIYDEDTIIMYRGKNYVQPPTEIMSPKITLSRRKALDKSKYRESLREVRRYIPRLEQELENLREQVEAAAESKSLIASEGSPEASNEDTISNHRSLKEVAAAHESNLGVEDHSGDFLAESSAESESEALSDIFETDSEQEADDRNQKPLYLDLIEKIPSKDSDVESASFEEQLRQISAAWKNSRPSRRDEKLELDDVDRLFLRAGSLLRKKRR